MLKDFVCETANNPGTSATVNLLGAASGPFVTFATAGFSSGDPVFYVITDGIALSESGDGVFTTGTPNTLTRTTVKSNTSGTTSRLNFTGAIFVFCFPPASNAVYRDQNGKIAAIEVNGTIHADGKITADAGIDVTGTVAVTSTITAANGTAGSQVVNIGQFVGGVNSLTFPNGTIWKDGITGGADGSGIATVTFGVAFPTACDTIVATADSSGTAYSCTRQSKTTSGATFLITDMAGTPVPGQICEWMAKGR